VIAVEPSTEVWKEANLSYLEAELQRLRLLLQRRVHWLRRRWKEDPLRGYQGLVVSDAEADWLLAGDGRKAEARFNREDPVAAELTEAVLEAERNLVARRDTLAKGGMPPALEVLSYLFGLTEFERDVLLLCLAPELDPTFERLYAYAHDDMARAYATSQLAIALFARDGDGLVAARESFRPDAPLRRFCLLGREPVQSPAATPAKYALSLDERITDYLLGLDRLDEQVGPLLQPVPPTPLAPAHRDLAGSLADCLLSDSQQHPWPVVNIVGPADTGQEGIAWAVSERLGLRLYRLDTGRAPGPGGGRVELFRILEREAALSQLAFYLDVASAEYADPSAVREITGEVIERLQAFVILCSPERWKTGRDMVVVRTPKLDAAGRRFVWEEALLDVPHSLAGRLDAIVEQFAFGPKETVRAVDAAKGRAHLRAGYDGHRLGADDLWQACREQAGGPLDELAQGIVCGHTWEDIVLPEDVLRQLQEIAAQVANRPQVYERWGFDAKLSRGRGISVLFSGPSGTGKTMAAEVLANHLNLDLHRIDLAGVVSKYIGETEKNLRRVFDAAEQGGAILFFDEADALFGKRTEVKDSHDRYANIEVNYLLQRMEDYRGLAILATNKKSLLDQAFLRRLRFLVDFPFPDAAHRLQIWRRSFPAQANVEGLDYAFLARLEISGGNISNIALNAAFLAAEAGAPIRMEHVLHAARREYAKTDKLVLESEFGPQHAVMRR
jgi:hypothetical protein